MSRVYIVLCHESHPGCWWSDVVAVCANQLAATQFIADLNLDEDGEDERMRRYSVVEHEVRRARLEIQYR